MLITIDEIAKVRLPQKTESYTPIPHMDFVNNIKKELQHLDLPIKSEQYISDRKGNKLLGIFNLSSTNIEMGPSIAFRNSYDKSLSAGLVSGAEIKICTNGMFTGEVMIMRKHTGDADNFMEQSIFNQITGLGQEFLKLEEFSNNLKEQEFSQSQLHKIIGDLFLEEEAITSEQLNIFKRELTTPTFDYKVSKNNSWNIYNILTDAVKRTSHPSTYMNHHKKLYKYFNALI